VEVVIVMVGNSFCGMIDDFYLFPSSYYHYHYYYHYLLSDPPKW